MKLQGKYRYIISGVALVQEALSKLKMLRSSGLEKYSKRVFQHAEIVAYLSSVAVAMPRTGKCQQHRANVEAPTVDKYFKRSVILPILDHIISDLDSRFTKHGRKHA